VILLLSQDSVLQISERDSKYLWYGRGFADVS